jgi:YaaC-like Protein
VAVIDSLPMPLRGGPKIGRTLDAETPRRATVWRHIRALRHQPPGRAREGQRREVFCAALEQAEQLYAAAETVGDAARPILVFYGLSQAGRAVAAASTEVDDEHFTLSGHGISVVNLRPGSPLHELTVADKGKGSFTQLAPLLRSGTLPGGATLDDIWTSIPSLLGQPLGDGEYPLWPLRFEPHSGQGVAGTRREIVAWVRGLPLWPLTNGDPGQAVADYLRHYPALAESGQSHLVPDPFSPDEQQGGAVKALRCWPWAGPVDPASVQRFLWEFGESRTLPYLGDDDRWVFPRLGGGEIPLHPLLAWWALLFVLSMVARYEPASWTRHLDVDAHFTAVKLASALSLALDTCPQLILHAIRAVGGL